MEPGGMRRRTRINSKKTYPSDEFSTCTPGPIVEDSVTRLR
jgi:hypothetical protein